MKKLFFGLCLLSIAGFMSCKKTKDAIVAPTSTAPVAKAQLISIFQYSGNITYGTRYGSGVPADINISAEKKLNINFGGIYSKGFVDVTSFLIEKDKLKPGYIGEYKIELNNQGDADVMYVYLLSQTTANTYPRGNAVGYLKITNYDEKNKMLSGEYDYTIHSLTDPMSTSTSNAKTTDIKISGSFENIPINSY